MPGPLFKKDILSICDLTPDLAKKVLRLADEVKQKPGDYSTTLAGRIMVLIFEKPSLRTRVTFESGIMSLGGNAIYLAPDNIRMGEREPVCDVARNLSRWVNVIVARTYSHRTIEELASEASIPVINALSDCEHPCQALADFQTIRGIVGEDRTVVTYVGDGNNVCHSLLLLGAMLGHEVRVACPLGYEPDPNVVTKAHAIANDTGARIVIGPELRDLVPGSQFLYTDVWTSMGQESESETRRQIFAGFRLDMDLVRLAGPGAKVLHCLPAHRGEEITEEVINSPASLLYDQAENRLHAQKALLLEILKD
jgi:ornithine carbamoyltransferase